MNAPASFTTPDHAARKFGVDDRNTVYQHVAAARSVVRTIALAVRAQQDGSVEYENNDMERWQPAIDVAITKIELVRDVLIDVLDPPPVDWWTPLCLLEAMGAALWYGKLPSKWAEQLLDDRELDAIAQVAIEVFDSMMLELDGEAVSNV